MTGIGLGEGGLLFCARLLLILRLPVPVWHAVDDLTRVGIGVTNPLLLGRLAIPAAQAVPAEPREVHHVDVLHVGPLAQMLHQTAERGGLQFGAGLVIELRCGHDRPPPTGLKMACPAPLRHTPTRTDGRRRGPWSGTMRAPAQHSRPCSTPRWPLPTRARSWHRIC